MTNEKTDEPKQIHKSGDQIPKGSSHYQPTADAPTQHLSYPKTRREKPYSREELSRVERLEEASQDSEGALEKKSRVKPYENLHGIDPSKIDRYYINEEGEGVYLCKDTDEDGENPIFYVLIATKKSSNWQEKVEEYKRAMNQGCFLGRRKK